MLDLRKYAQGGGCGLKLSGGQLETMLSPVRLVSKEAYPVVVGLGAQYDYGAVALGDETVVVQSIDMIAPVCASARTFGEIVVAHALSDVYVAGASPFCAVAMVVLPDSLLQLEAASDLMEAISARLGEEGCFLLGGHTTRTGETLLIGLAVTGTASRTRLVGPGGALPGDVLVTTKALGTGLYIAADRQGHVGLDFQCALDSMRRTNSCMLALQEQVTVHAAVDISGFGILDALSRICTCSKVDILVYFESLPLLPQARSLAKLGYHTRLTDENYVTSRDTATCDGMSMEELTILNDPQTSGGLLIAIPRNEETKGLNLLRSLGTTEARTVGLCSPGSTIAKVTVRRY